MVTELGSWVAVFIVDQGGKYHVHIDDWNVLDAAYGNWVERRIDSVLHLTATDGEPIQLAASRISDFSRSTPESRGIMRELTALQKADDGFAESA